jgi:hypothetical protein
MTVSRPFVACYLEAHTHTHPHTHTHTHTQTHTHTHIVSRHFVTCYARTLYDRVRRQSSHCYEPLVVTNML